MSQFSNNAPKKSPEKWVWQFKVSPSGIITLSIFSCVILLFVFFCGMYVGKGQQPAPVRQELTTIIPEENKQEVEIAAEDIMRPEDLQFMQNLKNDTSAASPVTQEKPKTADPKTANTTQATPTTEAKPKAEVKPEQNLVYDYVFQVAAFKDETQADDLRAKLEGIGLRTKLVKEKASKGTWYKVQVLLRGNQDAATELLNTLTQIKITDALQVSKTAVKN